MNSKHWLIGLLGCQIMCVWGGGDYILIGYFLLEEACLNADTCLFLKGAGRITVAGAP